MNVNLISIFVPILKGEWGNRDLILDSIVDLDSDFSFQLRRGNSHKKKSFEREVKAV